MYNDTDALRYTYHCNQRKKVNFVEASKRIISIYERSSEQEGAEAEMVKDLGRRPHSVDAGRTGRRKVSEHRIFSACSVTSAQSAHHAFSKLFSTESGAWGGTGEA